MHAVDFWVLFGIFLGRIYACGRFVDVFASSWVGCMRAVIVWTVWLLFGSDS